MMSAMMGTVIILLAFFVTRKMFFLSEDALQKKPIGLHRSAVLCATYMHTCACIYNYIYMHIYLFQRLMVSLAASSFWVRMSLSGWALELAREVRWWGSSTCVGCPWGAIALGILLACCLGCCIGACVTLAFTSLTCRHILAGVLRCLIGAVSTGGLAPQPLGTRLAQYRRDL